ncbi:MFS transporter [Denitratisoma oestradiolicum]|uniref:Sugar transporter n=1 Tax=Denitratisoma oestradiolicum TaxID=311182 RepID=A0A6S6XUP3_9PROT|nr:MFS transporter [Denitratisoma oestradiolicum]TWO81333.1 MFS transporter [Denitratisoma oestradiolicum]CAB1368525.1 Sugar transporter [Denitratisoma oestradiolicum]
MDTQPRYRKVALAACFGTFLEWYDFLTFASLATYFATLFFPSENPVAGLLASLATFGIGMVVRPLGAALFGSLGDRHGRRVVFIATIALMGVTTFAVGLLPTYAQVGIWAPLMLLTLRILQGLAMGGEIGGATVYLTEHAPAGRRGLYTSVLQLMGPLGVMASTAQVVLLQGWLSAEDFLAWGWRVPFLVSALPLVISMKSRMALHESPIFAQLKANQRIAKTPLRECFRDRHTLGRMALLFCCISAGGSLLFFCSQVYAPVFLKTVVDMDPAQAGCLAIVATLALFPLTLLAGGLSDRIGRRPVLLAGLLLGTLAMVPVFWGLGQFAASPALVVMLLMLPVLALALITGPQTATLAELFPARTRYSAVALPHNLAAGWIGGLSPFMVTLIGSRSGEPLLGLAYPTTLLLIASLVGLRFLPETRNTALEQ